jgi:hypothetical protein
LSSVLAL